MRTVLLPPDVNPTAVDKYIINFSITALYDTNNRRGYKTNGTYGTHNKKSTQILG